MSLTEVPWNCFFPEVTLSSSLPHNLSLHHEGSKWYFAGTIETLFHRNPVNVTLKCSGIQEFNCGTLVFLPCVDYVNESECKSNLCSWCSSSSSPSGGHCSFCTPEFEDACFNMTGQHSSCFSAASINVYEQASSSPRVVIPMPSLLFASLIITFLLSFIFQHG